MWVFSKYQLISVFLAISMLWYVQSTCDSSLFVESLMSQTSHASQPTSYASGVFSIIRNFYSLIPCVVLFGPVAIIVVIMVLNIKYTWVQVRENRIACLKLIQDVLRRSWLERLLWCRFLVPSVPQICLQYLWKPHSHFLYLNGETQVDCSFHQFPAESLARWFNKKSRHQKGQAEPSWCSLQSWVILGSRLHGIAMVNVNLLKKHGVYFIG